MQQKMRRTLSIVSFILVCLGALAQGNQGQYTIRHDKPGQVIWGIGFEIQSDAINSGNKGLREDPVSVPHDLIPSERERFYNDMLKGFRYCRLAGGLYWRGLSENQRTMQGRWPEQMSELQGMMQGAGIEGLSLEYWSPAPWWKANAKYTGGDGTESKLRCYGSNFPTDSIYHGDKDFFFSEFGDALIADIAYLESYDMKVSMWGLQNEPPTDPPYSGCKYTGEQFHESFKAIAPRIRQYDDSILILCDSWTGQQSASLINQDPEARIYADAWVWHQIGWDANTVIDKKDTYLKDTYGSPVFQNEYEYLKGPASRERCLNTAMNIMNWFTFVESPTWFWIHALKPTYNQEASGYSLGFWRPWDDEETTDIEKGHWKYNDHNWISLAGFVKYMPWDSQRLNVDEDELRYDMRIFSFKTPEGRTGIVVANRSNENFTFNINTGISESFVGYRYTPENGGDDYLGTPVGASLGNISPTLPPLSYEVWMSTGGDDVPTFFLPPDLVSGKADSINNIVLNWENSASDIDGLILERALSDADFEVVAQLSAADSTFLDPELEQLSQYFYRLKAFKGNDTTHYSMTAVVKTNMDLSLTNLALNKAVVTDSHHNNNRAENAVDGNTTDDNSRWVSANDTFPHWIEIDLGQEYNISALRFWTGWQGYNKAIKKFTFEYFKNEQWHNIITETANTEASYAKAFQAIKAQQFRLHATQGVDNYFRLYEIEILGTDLTLQLQEQTTNAFNIYPNPTADNQIVISGMKDITHLSLFDLSGKKRNCPREKNTIDISSLEQGVYIVSINNQHQQFIKQ